MNIDTNSSDWRAIKEYCENRLQELRIQNDNAMPETDTAEVRGQIKFVKELIGLGEKKVLPNIKDQSYL